jgi:V-type H+-transporting ATPase subunit a
MQFVDLNPNLTPFQRRYVQFIKRCDEIERKIRYVHAEAKKFNIAIEPAGTVESFFKESRDMDAGASGAYVLESLESKLDIYHNKDIMLNINGKLLESPEELLNNKDKIMEIIWNNIVVKVKIDSVTLF